MYVIKLGTAYLTDTGSTSTRQPDAMRVSDECARAIRAHFTPKPTVDGLDPARLVRLKSRYSDGIDHEPSSF